MKYLDLTAQSGQIHVYVNLAAISHIVARSGETTLVLESGVAYVISDVGPNVLERIRRAETEPEPWPTLQLAPVQESKLG